MKDITEDWEAGDIFRCVDEENYSFGHLFVLAHSNFGGFDSWGMICLDEGYLFTDTFMDTKAEACGDTSMFQLLKGEIIIKKP